MAVSFLWYDLETFGRDPRRTRIAQFAAIRTDESLEEIGEPISLFCQPARDLLPSPEATLITGITPQQAQRDGLPEPAFFARLHDELSQPGTCAVGYNSIRFDDEFIRFGLYRNFYDAYEREWRNGNSRWDLLDVMRLMEALRPEGMEWPRRDDGLPSFKLEHLAQANGTRTGEAHEALSDVRALIGLARKMRSAQPRLWDYALKARDKKQAASLLDPIIGLPVLHISGKYPASRHCAALVLPLARHPRIDSRVIACDLDVDPAPLLALSPEEIADRLYTPKADLPEGEARVPLKEIHSNKCPVLVPLAHLREADLQRLGIDLPACLANAERLQAAPGLAEKVRRVFAGESARAAADPDAALYDGFVADADKRLFTRIRSSEPSELGAIADQLKDPRFPELLFRYRARNWPDSLDVAELQRWNDYRQRRLGSDCGLSEYSFASFHETIGRLRLTADAGPKQALLDSLEAWGRELESELAQAGAPLTDD
ncbi:MAG: exodeoxyribonuclease I [Gammaproteobacteria bacterium RIFCSPHIGHO2_12_FULL_63_22]|nr:MAG: exodeoxyribonuclease I [Gammaproteobacteria bacterium RIFCSPHIGHO2_12_FULL_63_22]